VDAEEAPSDSPSKGNKWANRNQLSENLRRKTQEQPLDLAAQLSPQVVGGD